MGGRSDDHKRRRRGEQHSSRRSERSSEPKRHPRKGTGGERGSSRGSNEPRRSNGTGNSGESRRSRVHKSARTAASQASTGGAFKLSSTRRAAVLAILVCAMGLSVSVPLRTYLSQRAELAAMDQREEELREQVRKLAERKAKLTDPEYLEALARKRLGYVRPGETPYVVDIPRQPEPSREQAPKPEDKPWYADLWDAVT